MGEKTSSGRDLDDLQRPSPTPQILYRYYNARGQLLYVGITGNQRVRQNAHARDDNLLSARWWRQRDPFADRYEEYATRAEVEYREALAIYEEDPKYNLQRPGLSRIAELAARVPDPQDTLRFLRAAWAAEIDAKLLLAAQLADERDHRMKLQRLARSAARREEVRELKARADSRIAQRKRRVEANANIREAHRTAKARLTAIIADFLAENRPPALNTAVRKKEAWIEQAHRLFFGQLSETAEFTIVRREMAQALMARKWHRDHANAVARQITGFSPKEMASLEARYVRDVEAFKATLQREQAEWHWVTGQALREHSSRLRAVDAPLTQLYYELKRGHPEARSYEAGLRVSPRWRRGAAKAEPATRPR